MYRLHQNHWWMGRYWERRLTTDRHQGWGGSRRGVHYFIKSFLDQNFQEMLYLILKTEALIADYYLRFNVTGTGDVVFTDISVRAPRHSFIL